MDEHRDDMGSENSEPLQAQTLASAVMSFVRAGELLGADLAPQHIEQGSLKQVTHGRNDQKGDEGSAEEDDSRRKMSEHDVQLLRLRTRSREIIIYPDAKYLCCVVQLLTKAGT